MTEPGIILNSSTIALNNILSQLRGEDNKALDEVSDTLTYVGYANPLITDISDDSWRILRIKISGTLTLIGWADGVTTYTKRFSDRATYTYLGG